MDKILIFGVGAKADEIAAFIREYNLYEITAFTVDEKYIKEKEFLGVPVYPVEHIEDYVSTETPAFVAVSQQLYLNRVRAEKYELLKSKGYEFANLISPKATVKCNKIGTGNWIKDFAYLAYQSEIGSNNVFGTFPELSHYSVVGDHNYIAGHSLIAGNSFIGNRNYVGVGSIIYNVVRIGDMCIVAGGAILKKNLPDYSICNAPECEIRQEQEKRIEYYIMPKKKG